MIRGVCVFFAIMLVAQLGWLVGCSPEPAEEAAAPQIPRRAPAAQRQTQPQPETARKEEGIRWEPVAADDPEWNATDQPAEEGAPAEVEYQPATEAPAEQPASESYPGAADSTSAVPAQAPVADATVYITKTGKRYHRGDCGSLSKSKVAISRSDAVAGGYTPCSICNP